MAPFRIGTCQQAKHGSCTKVQVTIGNTKRIAHTSSPSPFARKSNVDNVVLYFRQSAMNSAPCTPICRICNFAEEARTPNDPNGKTARTILFSSEDHLAPAKLKGLDLPMELEDITQSLYPIWSNWIIAQIQLQCIYWISLRTYFAGKSCLNDKTTYCCQYCVILQNFRYCTNPFGVNVITTLKYKRLQGFSMYTYPL